MEGKGLGELCCVFGPLLIPPIILLFLVVIGAFCGYILWKIGGWIKGRGERKNQQEAADARANELMESPRIVRDDTGRATRLMVGERLRIGSDPSCDVVVEGLERIHFEIFTHRGRFVTTWRGKKLAGRARLHRPTGSVPPWSSSEFDTFELKIKNGDRVELIKGPVSIMFEVKVP